MTKFSNKQVEEMLADNTAIYFKGYYLQWLTRAPEIISQQLEQIKLLEGQHDSQKFWRRKLIKQCNMMREVLEDIILGYDDDIPYKEGYCVEKCKEALAKIDGEENDN